MDMGKVYPLTWYDVNPGDTIKQSTSALVRCMQLLAPIMHPVIVRIHHFFVPYRIIHSGWESFITGGADVDTDGSIPYIMLTGDLTSKAKTLLDYMGIPPVDYGAATIPISALPFRAYVAIWNEYYRDKDISAENDVSTEMVEDTLTDHETLLRAAWEKDEFTVARPWAQRGEEVMIPLQGNPPITGIGKNTQNWTASNAMSYETGGSGVTVYNPRRLIDGGAADDMFIVQQDPNNVGYPNIRADLTRDAGISIEDLKLAMDLQGYKNRSALFGGDYQEYLRYAGVNRNLDARLSKPEYLGGGRQVIQFSEVLSTDGSNTGDMFGHGISAMRSRPFIRFIPEHGLIMTLMSVVPKAIYSDGIHKSFSKTIREEYFQRELQNLGSQEVLNKEVYAKHTTPNGTFGYRPQYDEYRSMPSGVSGEFRDSTMNHWHMARQFGSDPALNPTFVECNPTKRVFATDTTDCLYVMANHKIGARRAMMRFPKPFGL